MYFFSILAVICISFLNATHVKILQFVASLETSRQQVCNINNL